MLPTLTHLKITPFKDPTIACEGELLQIKEFYFSAGEGNLWAILRAETRETKKLQRTCNRENLNRLTPNDSYMSRTAPLTSKRSILYIYSTNIGTEHFKHALYSPFFFSSKCSLFHSANLFGSCIIHILYTGCA